MSPQEIEEFAQGPEPDRSEFRRVPREELGPEECDACLTYWTGGPERCCGAPNVPGYSNCRFHLFHAINGGYTVSKLRVGCDEARFPAADPYA
ncbi:hypothetical protein ACWFMI_12130 [Nocardiopsis terrae]